MGGTGGSVCAVLLDQFEIDCIAVRLDPLGLSHELGGIVRRELHQHSL